MYFLEISTAWVAVIATSIVAVALLGLLLDGRRTPQPSAPAAAAHRHAAVTAATAVAILGFGLVGGGLVGLSQLKTAIDGRLLAVWPGVACLLFVAVYAIGEITWPKPSGSVRAARLVSRRPGDVAPKLLRVHLRVVTGALLALLLLLAFVDQNPSLVGSSTERWEAAGPFPGVWYGIPIGAICVALLLSTELVLRLIAQRPAVPGVSQEWDVALRHRSARRLLRGSQMGATLSSAGALFVTYSAMGSALHPSNRLAPLPLWAALLACLVGVVATFWRTSHFARRAGLGAREMSSVRA